MTKLHTMLAVSSVVLVACGDYSHYRGVGFTGLDGEPRSVAESDARQGLVSRSVSSSEALAGLPPVVLQAGTNSVDELAGAAIANGGRRPDNAVPVRQDGQDRMLSTVQVNTLLFAVLRMPEGVSGRMEAGAGNAFLNSVPKLTGCLAAGGAYASGTSDRPSGLAVPLDCS